MKKSFLLLVGLYVLVVFALDIPGVVADGPNDDLTADVTVGTSAPSVGTITCIDDPLTLGAETTVLHNCSATITDTNGYENINSVRGTFFGSGSEGDSADTRSNYKNATCHFTNAGSGTTRNVECSFTVYYHADPASWTVYFNATDDGGLTGTNTDTLDVNTLVALNVTNTTIPFGTVALGGTSNQINMTIKNTGNVDIDLNINESLYNGVMYCTDGGSDNITTDDTSTGVKYNMTDGFSFDATTSNLTSTNLLLEFNLVEADQSGAPTAPTDDLYWLIKLPSTGLTGSCSTTVRISAAESS